MKKPGLAVWVAALALLGTALGFSQNVSAQGQGRAIVTVLPKHAGEAPLNLAKQDLSVKVDGKEATVTSWRPLQSPENRVELVLLIDGSARNTLGLQFDDIAHFFKGLPPNVKSAIAYMQNGSAVFAGPLSADSAQVLRALHLPGGTPGSDASPYFCLSDLAKNWPSGDRGARRVVLMVTNGVDNYELRYDSNDPYVQSAIDDSVRAGLIIYSIFWQSDGRIGRSFNVNGGGQNHLIEVSDATGGKSFWIGSGNPVSFASYFDEIALRLRSQYELGFATPLSGKPRIETLKLKLNATGVAVNSPQNVMVFPAAAQN
jgi:hypothetical protein